MVPNSAFEYNMSIVFLYFLLFETSAPVGLGLKRLLFFSFYFFGCSHETFSAGIDKGRRGMKIFGTTLP